VKEGRPPAVQGGRRVGEGEIGLAKRKKNPHRQRVLEGKHWPKRTKRSSVKSKRGSVYFRGKGVLY